MTQAASATCKVKEQQPTPTYVKVYYQRSSSEVQFVLIQSNVSPRFTQPESREPSVDSSGVSDTVLRPHANYTVSSLPAPIRLLPYRIQRKAVRLAGLKVSYSRVSSAYTLPSAGKWKDPGEEQTWITISNDLKNKRVVFRSI